MICDRSVVRPLVALCALIILGMPTVHAADTGTEPFETMTTRTTSESMYGPMSQLEDFMAAGAAAEVCSGLSLSGQDLERFFRFLAIRDPEHRSPDELAALWGSKKEKWRNVAALRGCNAPETIRALNTWELRVKPLAGLDKREQSPSEYGLQQAEKHSRS